MEEAKKVNSAKDSDERVKNDTWGGGCPWWIFGNEDSAKKDLDDKFEIVDDEKD